MILCAYLWMLRVYCVNHDVINAVMSCRIIVFPYMMCYCYMFGMSWSISLKGHIVKVWSCLQDCVWTHDLPTSWKSYEYGVYCVIVKKVVLPLPSHLIMKEVYVMIMLCAVLLQGQLHTHLMHKYDYDVSMVLIESIVLICTFMHYYAQNV